MIEIWLIDKCFYNIACELLLLIKDRLVKLEAYALIVYLN